MTDDYDPEFPTEWVTDTETVPPSEYLQDPEADEPDEEFHQRQQSNQRQQIHQDETGFKPDGRTPGVEEGDAVRGVGAPYVLLPLAASGSSGSSDETPVLGRRKFFGPKQRSEMMALLEPLRQRAVAERLTAYRVAFELARIGRNFTTDVLELEDTALAFFTDMKFGAEEGFAEMMVAWDKVRFPEGAEPWNHALGQSRRIVHDFDPAPGKTLLPYANLAYQLSRVHGPDVSFLMPVELVGKGFGVTHVHAGNCIRSLMRLGLLECTCPSWTYRDGKAREFKFVARSNGLRLLKSQT